MSEEPQNGAVAEEITPEAVQENPDQSPPPAFLIMPHELAQALVNYLKPKPWEEVAGLLNGLFNCVPAPDPDLSAVPPNRASRRAARPRKVARR